MIRVDALLGSDSRFEKQLVEEQAKAYPASGWMSDVPSVGCRMWEVVFDPKVPLFQFLFCCCFVAGSLFWTYSQHYVLVLLL